MSYEIWCRHFNGIQHATCRAGIGYADVRDSDSHPYRFPCFKDQGCTDRCEHASFRTPEEVAEKERESSEALRQYLDNMAKDICPHCQKPIEDRKQVGRCVYALPCYCRLYQGQLPKKEKSIQDHPFFREQRGEL